MDTTIRRLAVEQRKRLIAGLLNAVEGAPWYSRLSEAERKTYRSEVMARVGTYHDFMLDIIKVTDDDSVLNEHAVTLIEQVHAGQRNLERAMRDRATS